MASGVFIRGSFRCGSLGLFYSKVQNFQHFILMLKNSKPVFLAVFVKPMFFQWILDLVVSCEWILRSLKPCFDEGVCRCPFPLPSLPCNLFFLEYTKDLRIIAIKKKKVFNTNNAYLAR
jgi:hypothetical protein